MKNILAKLGESYYEPLICQTVGQKLFLHFFFKHDSLPLNAKVNLEKGSNINFLL